MFLDFDKMRALICDPHRGQRRALQGIRLLLLLANHVAVMCGYYLLHSFCPLSKIPYFENLGAASEKFKYVLVSARVEEKWPN